MAKWTVPPKTMARRAANRIDLVVAKATFDAFSSAIRRSPVDTGRFRANWNVALGAYDASTTESTNASRVEIELKKALSFPAGGVVYLTNSLPYSLRLEDGWSRQAPSGIVRVTAIEWSGKLAQAIRSARG